MFERLASIGLGSGRLLRSEGAGLLLQVQRSILWSGAALLSGSFVLVGVVGLLVAGTAMLARETGWVAALLIVSGVVILTGVGLFFAARQALLRSTKRRNLPLRVRLRSEEAKMQIRGEPVPEGPHAAPSGGASNEATDWKAVAVDFATKNPALVAGGALCLVAMIGPWRSVKLLSRGVMLAGLASNLQEQMSHHQNGGVTGGENGEDAS